jgi:hypothetical protein
MLPLAIAISKEDDPNSVKFYVNSSAIKMLKNKRNNNSRTKNRLFFAPPNFSQAKFYLWTPENGAETPLEFQWQFQPIHRKKAKSFYNTIKYSQT